MTIINNPPPQSNGSGGAGFLLGIFIFIIFILFLIYYVLPQFTGSKNSPQINVPGKIDINVRQK